MLQVIEFLEDAERRLSLRVVRHTSKRQGRALIRKRGKKQISTFHVTIKTFEQNINTSSYMLYDQLQGREEKRFSHCSRSTSEEQEVDLAIYTGEKGSYSVMSYRQLCVRVIRRRGAAGQNHDNKAKQGISRSRIG